MRHVSPPGFVRRILSRLESAERREIDPHFQDDYRIAWITVLYADRGFWEPQVAATYAVIGLHPSKVWAAIVERRKAALGFLYEEFYGEGVLPSKKPPASVRSIPQHSDRAA